MARARQIEDAHVMEVEEGVEAQMHLETDEELLQSDDDSGDDASCSFAAYLNRADTEPTSAAEFDLLARTNFHQETDDYSQRWFNPHADRDMAQQILSGHPTGTYFVRPSSQAGCYASSFVNKDGEVKHHIIYCLFPGYSMDQHSMMTESGSARSYDSVSEVVENCSDLQFPLEMEDNVKRMCKEHQMKQGIGLVQTLVKCLRENDHALTSISWSLACVSNSLSSVLPGQSFGLRSGGGAREESTHIRYCLEHHTASGLLPMNGATAKLLFQAIESNHTVRGVQVRGYQDTVSRVITPNVDNMDVKYLARALCKNATLTSVDLCYNNITDLGARYLAEGLKRNSAVRNVNLSSNYLSAVGVRAIARALCHNRTIDSILIKNQLVASNSSLFPVLQNSEEFKYLCSAIESALARKREFGLYSGYSSDLVRRGWKCPFFGFRQAAEVNQLLRKAAEGTYLFYVNSGYACVIFLAFVRNGAVMHKRVHKAEGGYSMRVGKARSQAVSLFEMCSWKVSAMANERCGDCVAAEKFLRKEVPEVLHEGVLRIFYLTPLWGLMLEALESGQGAREGVYSSLRDLVKRNQGGLMQPYTGRQ